MDFQKSEEQQMLDDSIGSWMAANNTFADRQSRPVSECGYCEESWQTFAEMGWLALMFPEQDDGFAGGPEELMLMMENIGRGLVKEPFLATVVLAGGVIKRMQKGQLRTRLIEGIVSGELQCALAFVEPQSRYCLFDVATVAEPTGTSSTETAYRINGMKAVVLNGAAADKLIVVARTSGEQKDDDGLSLFVVDAKAEGVLVTSYLTQDGTRAADITFQDVLVENDALIGVEGDGLATLAPVMDEATFAVCAEAIGLMDYLLSAAVEYSKNRKQFGVPIGTFQALQHRMADMYGECEQARSIVLWACGELQSKKNSTGLTVSACKSFVGDAARFVGQQAIQIHGGIGVTNELDVAHYFKRLTVIENLFGNTDYHLRRYALGIDALD